MGAHTWPNSGAERECMVRAVPTYLPTGHGANTLRCFLINVLFVSLNVVCRLSANIIKINEIASGGA